MNVLRSCETLWWDGVEEIVEEEDFCVWLRLRWMITIRRTSSYFLQWIRQFHRSPSGSVPARWGRPCWSPSEGGWGYSRGLSIVSPGGFSEVSQGFSRDLGMSTLGANVKKGGGVGVLSCFGNQLNQLDQPPCSLTWVPYRVLLLSATLSLVNYFTWV